MNEDRIIIRNTNIIVYNSGKRDQNNYNTLKMNLSVRQKELNGAQWVSFLALLMDLDPNAKAIMRLPLSIPEKTLYEVFPYHTIEYNNRGWRFRTVNVKFKSSEFPFKNENQSKVFKYLCNPQRKAHLVVAGTAAGKSYCSIRAWTENKNVLLGTFAQNNHLQNFYSELLKFTDLTPEEILVIDDGRNTIQKIMGNDKLIPSIKAVLVLHRTVQNCIKDKISDGVVSGMNDFSKFILKLGVGTHISDECHLEYQSLIYLGMLTNISNTYYLSATPNRTNWMEDRVLHMHLPMDHGIYIKSESRLETKLVEINTHPTDYNIKKSQNRKGYFDVNYYFDYLTGDKWDYIEGLLYTLTTDAFENSAESLGIVVSGRLEFLDLVIMKLGKLFPNKTIGNFSSRVKIKDRVEELKKDIVVTTEKSMGGSVNPERMTHLIFLAPIASPVWLEQISGRLRGLDGRNCIVYSICDYGFPVLVDQMKQKKKTFKKLSTSITEIKYDS